MDTFVCKRCGKEKSIVYGGDLKRGICARCCVAEAFRL
jgi:NMD protein affecting ribosome stability and mRNA decay